MKIQPWCLMKPFGYKISLKFINSTSRSELDLKIHFVPSNFIEELYETKCQVLFFRKALISSDMILNHKGFFNASV